MKFCNKCHALENNNAAQSSEQSFRGNMQLIFYSQHNSMRHKFRWSYNQWPYFRWRMQAVKMRCPGGLETGVRWLSLSPSSAASPAPGITPSQTSSPQLCMMWWAWVSIWWKAGGNMDYPPPPSFIKYCIEFLLSCVLILKFYLWWCLITFLTMQIFNWFLHYSISERTQSCE